MQVRELVVLMSCAVVSLGCGKKPTAAQCDQAWQHVEDLQAASAAQDLEAISQRMGNAMTPEQIRSMTARTREAHEQGAGNPVFAAIAANAAAAMRQACLDHPVAAATCIERAQSVDELVNTCHMRATPGARGAVALAWPE